MATPNQRVYVVANSKMLGTRRIRLRDWADLVNTAPMRGENAVMPGAVGRRRFVKRRDERPATLLLQIDGRYDDDGAEVVGDPALAALETIEELDADLGVGLVSVTFEWHRYGTSTLYGDVQIVGLYGTGFPAPHLADTTLDLILPPVWSSTPP